MKIRRNIVEIDEELCNGCGICILNCAEGAMSIENGKAKVFSDALCDGIGACIGTCPTGALKIIEREAVPFDESLVHAAVLNNDNKGAAGRANFAQPVASMNANAFSHTGMKSHCSSLSPKIGGNSPCGYMSHKNGIRNWPIKLRLSQAIQPCPEDGPVEIIVAADCVAAAMPEFYEKYAKGRYVYTACPKFEDTGELAFRLSEIIRSLSPASVTLLRIEVPCCQGLFMFGKGAVNMSGQHPLLQGITIGQGGHEEKSETWSGQSDILTPFQPI